MKRRDFVGGAASWVALGCSTRDPLDNQPQVSERTFPAAVTVDEAAFPQSVVSGDPKPDGVVLWTRTPQHTTVLLQVASDPDFERLVEHPTQGTRGTATVLELKTAARHDHCVRVRINDLSPGKTYYYRFIVDTNDGPRCSRTGRTKTAPRPDEDTRVRFVVLSCNDYSGRYYHCFRQATALDPDFVVHLGDYIYETTDDPRFQHSNPARAITFRDVDGAQEAQSEVTDGSPGRLAARSLDNYRQLYQIYRTDPDLQRLHERAAFIVVWDDHEFANDATGEQIPELVNTDSERRSNADRAWCEYMPIDYAQEPMLDEGDFPDNLRIYRDFRFGRHVHLVMTDLRRFRPGPLIAEDAFPGSVLVTEARLRELFGEVPNFAAPYVNLDSSTFESHRLALQRAAPGFGIDAAMISGNQDIAYLNTWVKRLNDESGSSLPMLLESEADGRGIAPLHVGKTELRSNFGARYFVIEDVFQAVALAAYRSSAGESENLLGTNQRAWFLRTLRGSDATWKVWGNEYTLLRKVANLEPLPLSDPSLRHRFLISVDDWDGVPNERLALLEELQNVHRLVVVTGDIHSFFVGSTGLDTNVQQPIEFVCGAVSSATYESLLSGSASLPQAMELGPYADAILRGSNPHVAYQDLASNGFALIEADASRFDVMFYQLPSELVLQPNLPGELADNFLVTSHRLDPRLRLSRGPFS
jgi:alkaline phosphatase D